MIAKNNSIHPIIKHNPPNGVISLPIVGTVIVLASIIVNRYREPLKQMIPATKKIVAHLMFGNGKYEKRIPAANRAKQ